MTEKHKWVKGSYAYVSTIDIICENCYLAAVVILPFTHFLTKDPLTFEYVADE